MNSLSPPDIRQVDGESDDGEQEVHLPRPRLPLILAIEDLLRCASYHFRS